MSLVTKKYIFTHPEYIAQQNVLKMFIDKSAITDPAAVLAVKKRFWCKYLLSFCVDVLGYHDLNDEHVELCRQLESAHKNKMVLMPRYTFKSCIATEGYSLWRLAKNVNLRILIYSDASTKAEGFLGEVVNHILGRVETSRFKEMFGEWEHKDKSLAWNRSQVIIKPRTSGQKEPSIDTSGIESSKTGCHYDVIIFDDIVSETNVTTKSQMDKVSECYKKSLSLLKPGGDVVMVGTRWHFGDLYGRLIAENKQTKLFNIFIRSAYKGEKYFFNNIGPESLTPERLQLLKNQQGTRVFSCNPYEAPIIMGDWRAKPIGEVKKGDEVIGWTRIKNNRKRLCKSKVLKVQSRKAQVVKVIMKSGRTIRCTPDHRWYSRPPDKTHQEYKPAQVGSRLHFAFEPYLKDLGIKAMKSALWLGGLYDGEGDCTDSVVISQSHHTNPEVCEKLKSSLAILDYSWNSCERAPTRTAWGKSTTSFWINGGIRGKRRFLLECEPVKGYEIENSILKHGSSFVKEKDKVVSIEPDGFEEVFALQTETENYIAWGYLSKNCLYQNEPTDDETATFKVKDFAFSDFRAEDLYVTGTIDPAGQGEDFTAITVVGTDIEMNMYLLEIVNQNKMTPNEMIERIINLNYKYKFKMFGIETNFFRGTLKLDLEDRVSKEHVEGEQKFPLFGIHEFKASSRVGEGKYQRILGLQPYHERGAIKFPETNGDGKVELLQGAYSELAYQMIQFPNASHDDILDSLAYHLPLMRKGGVVKKSKIPRDTPAWLERKAYEREMDDNMRLPRRLRQRVHPLAFS